MTERWLLDRAVALLEALVAERDREARQLVSLPPEGASLHEIERAALVAALDRANWVQTKAATLLGLTPRVFFYKMGRYKLYDESPLVRKRAQRPYAPLKHKPPPRKAGKDWRLDVGSY